MTPISNNPSLVLAKRYIRDFEGFAPRIYKCSAKKNTIGFGHAIKQGESFDEVSITQAEEILDTDTTEVYTNLFSENGVLFKVNNMLNTYQKAALVCFVFNVGIGAFKESTMRRLLIEREIDLAADQFDRWIWFTNANGKKVPSKGLKNRRVKEKTLFLSKEVC